MHIKLTMKKLSIIILILNFHLFFTQKILVSWGQQTIEGLTEEKFNDAQKLTSEQLLKKNVNDKTWCDIFLTLNSSVNNQTKNKDYLKGLTDQIINKKITLLEGTSKLIIWDRIISGDILFEGKGLIIENDLFTTAGRANQLLQNLTNKNFGYISIHSTDQDLLAIKNKWLTFLSDESVDEFHPIEFKNSKIPIASNLNAVEAFIISIQTNPKKDVFTKKCLQKIYKLDAMPKEKGPEMYCNPDTYSYANLGMLFGDSQLNETKDAKWWKIFWDKNNSKLT
jgi:hypothetical protein